MTKDQVKVGVRICDSAHGEVATIIELTEKGFKYELDRPYYSHRPHYGLVVGGEVYENGYMFWDIISERKLFSPVNNFPFQEQPCGYKDNRTLKDYSKRFDPGSKFGGFPPFSKKDE